MLFLEWRVEEMERINQTADGAERKAALCMLLDQETQLILAIGRHKIEADTENKDKRIQQFLSKVSYHISQVTYSHANQTQEGKSMNLKDDIFYQNRIAILFIVLILG